MENSWRSKKRAIEDLVAAPDDEGDTDTHGIIASTSSLAANAPNVKRGTSFHMPRLIFACSHRTLYVLSCSWVQLNAPRRVNVPFAETTSRCASLGSISRSRAREYKLSSITSAISTPSQTPTPLLTRRMSFPFHSQTARLTSTGPSRVVAPPLLKPPTPPPSSLRASPRLSVQ